MMRLGRILRASRVLDGDSLRERAEAIGIDRQALWRLERGQPVNLANFTKLLSWLTGETSAAQSVIDVNDSDEASA